MLDNKYIHQKCGLVEEPDLKEATDIGMKMLQFVRAKKYLSLAANQVGYDKQVVVVKDNDGHDIYFNPEINIPQIKDGMFEVDQNSFEFPAVLPSFPRKRVLMEMFANIEINAFSVATDDRVTFTADGELAKIWQVMIMVLDGIDEESIVASDFMTVRRVGEKKRPNAKCPKCGRKNKVCACES